MPISSVADMKARAAVDFPDNTAQLITPAILRQFLIDFLDTISPAYGIIRMAAQTLNFSATPVVLAPFSQSQTESIPYFLNNLAAGQVKRTLAASGAAGSRTFINVNGAVGGPGGREVLIRLYKDGLPTDFAAVVTTTGATNRQSFAFSGFDFMLGVDAVYELRASSVGALANFNFENVLLSVQAQTVRAFV